MASLIKDDISRCNNHRCPKNLKCKRYLQLKIDFLEKGHKAIDKHYPTTRFDSNNCETFLKTELCV